MLGYLSKHFRMQLICFSLGHTVSKKKWNLRLFLVSVGPEVNHNVWPSPFYATLEVGITVKMNMMSSTESGWEMGKG